MNITAKDIAKALDDAKYIKQQMSTSAKVNPEDIIKWMNEIESKQHTRDEVKENIALAVKSIMSLNTSMSPADHANEVRFILVQVVEALDTIVKHLVMRGIL